jgi:hypothetical protein
MVDRVGPRGSWTEVQEGSESSVLCVKERAVGDRTASRAGEVTPLPTSARRPTEVTVLLDSVWHDRKTRILPWARTRGFPCETIPRLFIETRSHGFPCDTFPRNTTESTAPGELKGKHDQNARR